MPDPEKKNQDKQDEPDEKDVQRDALGNEIEPGPPELEVGGPEPDAKDENAPAPSDEADDKEDSDEPKDVPPDLVPVPKEDDQDEADEEKPDDKLEDEDKPGPEKPEPETDSDTDEAEDTPFDDEKTDKAIAEIVAKEGDDVLAAQDAAAAKGAVGRHRKRGSFWRNKWVRTVILFLLFGGLAAAAVVPTSRYWALNTAGVRSSSSLRVVDSTTQLPLKGVDVNLGGKEARTDSEGNVSFTNLRLGQTRLLIKQVGFEQIRRDIVIGWGSNPLGNFALKATGVQYVIEVKDYLSGKPLEGVEATNGEATAVSGKDGKITLTLENTVVAKGSIALSKAGYRSEAISLNEDPEKPTQATMVIDQKTVFVSRENGKYDLYKSDIDGQNREVLLAATGNENSNISLVVSPDGTRAAFVSTRGGKRDSSGFLLSSLVLVNIGNGSTTTIAEAAQIQLLDWVGSRLVFQLGSSDSGDENRYTVVSYDYGSNTRVQLAAANKLQAVVSVRGTVFYAPAAGSSDEGAGLFKIGADGKNKQQVFDEEVASVLRSDYGTLNVQTTDGTWIKYDIAAGSKTQVGTPDSLANRLYIDNEDRSKSLWISQSVLRLYDTAASKDTEVTTASGLVHPLRWAGKSAAIFRVSNASETADYAASLDGGTPRKIADVTPTYGFSQAQ